MPTATDERTTTDALDDAITTSNDCRAIERLLDKHRVGATLVQVEVLHFLEQSGGAIETMREVNEFLGVSPAVTTGIVDRLQREGYAERESREHVSGDRRRIGLAITDKGREALDKARCVIGGME